MTDSSAQNTWTATLGQLEMELPRATFDTWLKDTEGLAFDGMDLLVQVPSVFTIAWLEQRMYQTILRALRQSSGEPLDVRFRVPSEIGEEEADPPPAGGAANASGSPAPPVPMNAGVNFDRKYSFNNFVVGTSNRMAFSAAQAVADAPGQAYNPLFLYSGVGLGKTHLLHAIGQEAARNGHSVLYVSSEQFTNDFISAIRNRTTEEFRQRYRSVQVLLIDDVQFMSGKEQTQEGFFHTFNDLHTAGYQIVLTSDRPPKALALLEDRLRSRFEWGLIADIQPPDLETRMAILSSKADQLKTIVEESVLELIAKRVQKNVRELEGSLNRVVAYSQLMSIPVTLESTSRLLDDLTHDIARHAIDREKILDEVSRHYKVSTADLLGRSRSKNIALARQVAMYLLIYELELSPTEVGRLLGNRDHSTVIHGAGKINGEINEDYHLRQNVLTIKEAIFT
ncbi:MAG: chromosomal replication initiator protein DnaA [Chloroflexota bacterium]|nr:chromosomal replication initiator protein DnaA [Chloroflexota bacterium]